MAAGNRGFWSVFLAITVVFLVLGVASFAVLAPLGLLLWKTQAIRGTLAQLAPALSVACAGIVGLGLLIHHRATAERLTMIRAGGTWTALVGASLMLMAVVLAWPRPSATSRRPGVANSLKHPRFSTT